MKEEIFFVKDLCKRYGKKQVLNNISFSIKQGEVLGILGSNGAGKSTMIKIISGLSKCSSGEINFANKGMSYLDKQYKNNLGIVPQDISLYENMTVKENLVLFSRLYGLKGKMMLVGVNNLIEELHLEDKANTEVRKLSGGMKRRVNIAAAIVHNPQLIIMDEPTVGIDPENRKAVWEIIENQRKKKKSIILVSHYIEEIEELSDNVIIIEKGTKVAEGSPSKLIEKYGLFITYSIEFYNIINKIQEKLIVDINNNINSEKINVIDNKIDIVVKTDQENYMESLIGMARSYKLEIKNINIKKADLEDVFISFIKEPIK
jgi:ABC-type multidrug transport system, ATPase component